MSNTENLCTGYYNKENPLEDINVLKKLANDPNFFEDYQNVFDNIDGLLEIVSKVSDIGTEVC